LKETQLNRLLQFSIFDSDSVVVDDYNYTLQRPNAETLLNHPFIQMYVPQEQSINDEISKIIQEMIEAKALLESSTTTEDDNTSEVSKEPSQHKELRLSF
jgi:hypothetical protein